MRSWHGHRWAIFEGDFRQLLPRVAARLRSSLAPGARVHVLTDPPYEPRAHNLARRQEKKNQVGKYVIPFAPLAIGDRAVAAQLMVEASTGWVLAFSQIEGIGPSLERLLAAGIDREIAADIGWRAALEAAGARWMRGQIWRKPDAAPQFSGDRPGQGHESIATAWAASGRSTWNGGGRHGFYEYRTNDYAGRMLLRPHPTSKPLALMRELVDLFTRPGDAVIDPYMGSGSTLIAAWAARCVAVGIERDPMYAEPAAARMQELFE